MDWLNSSDSPYVLLLTAASLIPIYHYFLGLLFVCLVFLYNFLEIHILQDFFTGFRGQPVSLTFDSCSEVYREVVSKCRILHGRYLSTPWLSSPHLQTSFLSLFGQAPCFSYKRQLFHTTDGGTIALDWLTNYDEASLQVNNAISKDDKTPIVIVVPGLTSDSDSAYIKHFAFKMAKCGWNVIVSNHRGLGGVSLTSDCFYNAGWTEDLRKVIDHFHSRNPEAPLFLIGCSIGANIVVKYLGEDGINTPIAGAVAICSPWDLLICDRFINRRTVQKFYDKALTVGLKGYAQLHQTILTRLADWEGIEKSRSVRDFDHYATRVLAKFETVDTYYRRCSSSNYVGNVMVPLLCISALDDPLCTREAIPFDECRGNKNIVLATTQHGGHLAYYEGIMGKSLWWVRAAHEFFNVLHSSSLIYRKKEICHVISPQESSIDQGPYVGLVGEGMITAISDDQITNEQDANAHDEPLANPRKEEIIISETHQSNHMAGERIFSTDGPTQLPGQDIDDLTIPVRYMDQLSRHSRKSVWLLAYIAIITTWPLVGSALKLFLKKKFNNMLPAALRRI